MLTLRENALRLCLDGETTLDEVTASAGRAPTSSWLRPDSARSARRAQRT